MPAIAYPLLQVMDVKKKRVQDAERVVKEKEIALQKEKDKLAEREADRDKAIGHHNAKLTQLRKEMDEGTTSDKILQMKAYLKVAKDRVKIEEKKVKEQLDQVAKAAKDLQNAQLDLRMRRQEVDKLETHRKDWLKEILKEQEIIDGREMDEIGTVIFSSKKRTKIS